MYDRINRIQRKNGIQVRKSRSLAMEQNCGRFYSVDTDRNIICDHNLNLESVLFLIEEYSKIVE